MKKNNKENLIFFIAIAIIFLGQWYLAKNNSSTFDLLNWLLASIFMLFVFPIFIIKRIYKRKVKNYYLKLNFLKDNQVKIIVLLEILLVVGLLYFFMVKLGWAEHFRVYTWFFGSWSVILFIELIILPLVIFSEEFFFRGFVLKTLLDRYKILWALLIQAFIVIIYQAILSSSLAWQLLIVLFVVNIFLSWMVAQTRTIWISFLAMLLFRYLIDGYILYQVKFLLGN